MDNYIQDEDQISRLYREMYSRMLVYASSVLRNQDLAEEAVQDTFCILCTKANEALKKENPHGWLMRTLQICDAQHEPSANGAEPTYHDIPTSGASGRNVSVR